MAGIYLCVNSSCLTSSLAWQSMTKPNPLINIFFPSSVWIITQVCTQSCPQTYWATLDELLEWENKVLQFIKPTAILVFVVLQSGRFKIHVCLSCSVRKFLESKCSTCIHTYIHVAPPIPSLTCVLFEGELLWSASASVQGRPSQLVMTANELHKAARAAPSGFDRAQVKVPVARVGTSKPPLDSILRGGASNQNPSESSFKHSCCSNRQDGLNWSWTPNNNPAAFLIFHRFISFH